MGYKPEWLYFTYENINDYYSELREHVLTFDLAEYERLLYCNDVSNKSVYIEYIKEILKSCHAPAGYSYVYVNEMTGNRFCWVTPFTSENQANDDLIDAASKSIFNYVFSDFYRTFSFYYNTFSPGHCSLADWGPEPLDKAFNFGSYQVTPFKASSTTMAVTDRSFFNGNYAFIAVLKYVGDKEINTKRYGLKTWPCYE